MRSIIKLAAIVSAIAAPTFASSLTLSQLSSAWEFLTFVAVISTICVWYGVSLESEGNSALTRHQGARVVVVSLLIESWTGWALWQTDDAITDIKDAQIAILQKAREPRHVDAAKEESFVKSLSGFDECGVTLGATPPLYEAKELSLQLNGLFLTARIDSVIDDEIVEDSVGFAHGIAVQYASSGRCGQPFASAVTLALTKAGLAAFTTTGMPPAKDMWIQAREHKNLFPIWIAIGDKP